MLTLPPIPSWQGIHPLVVHFPIAMLLIAPLFIIIGIMRKPDRGFPFLVASLILMGLGTVSLFVAVSSGHAAGELAENLPGVKHVIEQHEELASETEIIFSALTLIFASILFGPRMFQREPTRMISTVLPLVFLLFYATGVISLANTAHQGGRLVHQMGVRAPMQPGALATISGERE